MAGIAQMGALAVFPTLAKYVNKRIVFLLSTVISPVGFVALLVVGYLAPTNIILVGVCSAIVNIGIGFMLVLVTVILSEAVDYGEFKLGTRNESIVFSTQTFVVKFAGAFSGFMSAAGLKIIGFVPNEVQSAGTVMGMRVIMIVLLAAVPARLQARLPAQRQMAFAGLTETRLPEGVELVTRQSEARTVRFLLNHNETPVTVLGISLAPFEVKALEEE